MFFCFKQENLQAYMLMVGLPAKMENEDEQGVCSYGRAAFHRSKEWEKLRKYSSQFLGNQLEFSLPLTISHSRCKIDQENVLVCTSPEVTVEQNANHKVFWVSNRKNEELDASKCFKRNLILDEMVYAIRGYCPLITTMIRGEKSFRRRLLFNKSIISC